MAVRAKEETSLAAFSRTLQEFSDHLLKHAEEATARDGSRALDAELTRRLADTTEKLFDLNERLAGFQLAPEAQAEIRDTIIRALQSVDEHAGKRPLDSYNDLLVAMEAIRHVIRDAVEGRGALQSGSRRELMLLLAEWLPRARDAELARIVGVSTRTLQRWRKSGGQPSRRLLLVAELVSCLHRSWTPEGVVAWFGRPRQDLAGKTPIEVLDDPAYEQALRAAVAQGRAQHGS